VPTCDGFENFLGEGELPSAALIARSHTALTFSVPPGLGTHTIAVSIGGNPLLPFSLGGPSTPMLVFGAPNITAAIPTHGPTNGGAQVTVYGAGFGVSPRNTSEAPVTFPADGSGLPLSIAATLPTVALRVNMHRGCVTDAYALDGSALPPVASCSHSVVSRSDTTLIVASAPGSKFTAQRR
jgi:hypothetical protein